MPERGKPLSPMMEKLRDVISAARSETTAPNSVPAISHVMLGRPFMRKLARVRGLRTHLIAGGLNGEIRRYLKRDPEEGDGISRSQLALWPTAVQRELI